MLFCVHSMKSSHKKLLSLSLVHPPYPNPFSLPFNFFLLLLGFPWVPDMQDGFDSVCVNLLKIEMLRKEEDHALENITQS